MDSASVKAKGRRAERIVADYLDAQLPEGWDVVRQKNKGAADEGDVQIVPPPPLRSRTVEVKYRTSSVGTLMLASFRRQAWVEAVNHGSDRALLVVNRPRNPVPRWTVHVSVDGQNWLMSEMDRLIQFVMIDSSLIRRFEDDLQQAAQAAH